MDFIYFLIIGLIAGWLAGLIFKGKGFGFINNLVVGCIGALLGGFVFKLLGISAVNIIGSLVAALIGAVILIWIISFIKKK